MEEYAAMILDFIAENFASFEAFCEEREENADEIHEKLTLEVFK